jgi:uncharacterized protein (DUF4415 family)
MSDSDMRHTSRTDWDRLAKMTDEEIDYSDIPPLTDEFFARARLVLPNAVALDPDVLAWFKHHEQDYPARINQVLREYIALHGH